MIEKQTVHIDGDQCHATKGARIVPAGFVFACRNAPGRANKTVLPFASK